jgi:transposase InsO family protein
MSVLQRNEADIHLQEIVRTALASGQIHGYGARLLQQWFRKEGYLTTRDRLYNIVRQLDPAGVKARTTDANRKKGEYIVPGPDYVWSMDGHEKLSPWGFEIYACIDAYSRCILWIYVGVSGRTANSVARQYLRAVVDKGYCPYIVRTDRGKETPIAAEVQYALSRTTQADPTFKIKDCFIYGTSTDNQRIESWWSQLQKSKLYFWRVRLNSYEVYYINYYRIISKNYLLTMRTTKAILLIVLLCKQCICQSYDKLLMNIWNYGIFIKYANNQIGQMLLLVGLNNYTTTQLTEFNRMEFRLILSLLKISKKAWKTGVSLTNQISYEV